MVDSVALLQERQKAGHSWPLFARGGTHWNHLSATIALQALLDHTEAASGKSLPDISVTGIRVDHQPQGSDTDLADLLSLPRSPTDYPAVKFDYRISNDPGFFRPKVYWVGNSFSWTLLDLCHTAECRLFSSIDFGYYFGEFSRWDDVRPWIEPEKYTANFTRTESMAALKNAELIVLEMNEGALPLFDYSLRFSREAVQWLQSKP